MIKIYVNNKLFALVAGMPANARVQTLSGSEAFHTHQHWGTVILQRLKQWESELSLYYCKVTQNLEFVQSPVDGLSTTIALNNVIDQTICGAGMIRIKDGQLTSCFGNAIERKTRLRKQREYLVLNLFWTRQLLVEVLPADSKYWDMLTAGDNQLPIMVGEPYRWSTSELRELIHAFLDSPYSETIQSDSIHSLMIELLENILAISANRDFLVEPISAIEVRKIEKAQAFILEHLDHHYTSEEIAEQVGLCRTTLIRRFRQLTGKSLQEFLLYHRCASICNDLIQTDIPYKVLAKKSGYSDVPNFINGFKKHMGCSPTALRKK